MNTLYKFILAIALGLPVLSASGQSVLSFQISSSMDDVEEQGTNGASPGTMDVTSSDIELVIDGGDGNQFVGLRFNGITIPQGAFITNAYIQFTVDETDIDSTSVWIKAEDAVNGPAFSSAAFNVSSRSVINDSVLWEDIPAWNTVGQAGPDQQTPSIAALIQTLVNQPAWASGNAINIIMTGVGSRTAESHNGSASQAPELVVEFYVPTVISLQVNNSSDDAEEQGTNGGSPGTIDLTSSDLELVKDGGDGDQFVGIRFNGVGIPQGSLITSAYIQFTVDEFETDSTSVWITAEDALNPTTFLGTPFNISSRTTINDSVLWENIPQWPTAGQANADQRTPDLVSLVQHLVDQGGWNSGNAMSFIITGIGQRTAESYDGTQSSAPELIIGYVPDVAPIGLFPIQSGAVWAYHDSGFALPVTWIDTTFNDSSWSFGPAELGYGDGGEATILDFGPNPSSKYPTYYLRQKFEAIGVNQWDSLKLSLMYDDGAAVYINGQEVYRVNLPAGALTYNSLAINAIAGAQESQFTEVNIANVLVEGLNTIAVEMHQNAVTSSDLSFDLMLEGILPPMQVDSFPLAAGLDWYYLDNGSNQDTAWRQFLFDPYAEGWAQGPAQLGYGDGDEATVVSFGPNSGNKYITTYFYKEVYVNTAITGDTVLLGLLRDDAAAVYINGELAVIDNLPATYDYTTWSSSIVDGANESIYFQHLIPTSMFNNGLNSIAVEIHQRDGTSSDISFNMYLDTVPEPPVAGGGCTNGQENHIGCFTSVSSLSQTQFLTIPETHAFQVIFQQGDAYDNFNGNAPGNHDFTGYVGANGSSTEGYVAVNHENTPGGVSVLDVHYDATNRVWNTDSINRVDFFTNALQTTTRNCSGGVTPWGTVITSEETYNGGDANSDGYTDVGWNVEVDPVTREVVGDTKLWALGRMSHENVVVANDSVTVFQGEDGGTSCVYKFIADTPGDLSTGDLFVLLMDQPLVGGEPTGTTGQWVQVPNTTQADRNNTRTLAAALGGTNFNGVEDCEISPIDGKIYFTSKGRNRVYRFDDGPASVTNFETFVGGTSYTINTDNGIITFPWGGGNDNLTFDELGNLWVQQDGSSNNIWMVLPEHTQLAPRVELFASTPNGSEPTGATFSPDHKFMFISIQHPSGANGNFVDASGNTFAFNKSTTIVVARKEHLGVYSPSNQATSAATANPQDCEQVQVTWTSGNGDRRLVIAKEGSAVDAFPADGMLYNANSTFGNGDDLGGGNFIVYDGTGNSVQIDGLNSQNSYHFAVVEYTEDFSSTFYNVGSPAVADFEFDAVTAESISGVDSTMVTEVETYNVGGTAGYQYTWSVSGGTLLAGQSTTTIAVEWNTPGVGEVAVEQLSSQGCVGDQVDFEVFVLDTLTDTITGLSSINGNVLFSIYPNPTSDVTTVDLKSSKNGQVSLYDITGSLVGVQFTRNGSKYTFDASSLQAGVYFLHLTFDNGKTTTQQLVVR